MSRQEILTALVTVLFVVMLFALQSPPKQNAFMPTFAVEKKTQLPAGVTPRLDLIVVDSFHQGNRIIVTLPIDASPDSAFRNMQICIGDENDMQNGGISCHDAMPQPEPLELKNPPRPSPTIGMPEGI